MTIISKNNSLFQQTSFGGEKRVHECGSNPHTAAELHYSQSVTDPDFHMKLPAACGHPFLKQTKKMHIILLQKNGACVFTFLCRPLNTTANAPCPTRSFLLYSKSPTVSIAMVLLLLLMLTMMVLTNDAQWTQMSRPPTSGGHSPTVPKGDPLSSGRSTVLLDDCLYVPWSLNR